jgi:hypothetical protein
MCACKHVCLAPYVTTIFPYRASILEMMSLKTDTCTWETFKSSTYQHIVHCFPLIILLATHMSYGFITNPIPSSVDLKSLYHNNALLIHPYDAFCSSTYSSFFPLFAVFAFTIYSAISPSNNMKTTSSMSACTYAPSTSAVATARFSLPSMAMESFG